jgi:hypothetical protein
MSGEERFSCYIACQASNYLPIARFFRFTEKNLKNKEKLGIDVEHSTTFVKALMIKKKHCFGLTIDGEIKVVGMEGKKIDRPLWIDRMFDQFLEDFKAD